MNVLITICARKGSKGLKNKNISLFNHWPLVYYTLSAYDLFKDYADFDRVDISINTDSEELIAQINNTSIQCSFIKRNELLAADTAPKVAVIRDTMLKSEIIKSYKYDFIIDLDITSPIRTSHDIDKAIQILTDNKKSELVFSMTSSRRSPYFNMVQKNTEGIYETVVKSSYIARQQGMECFDMNASIYVYRRSFLANEKNNRIFDGRAIGFLMQDTGILDIDKKDDLEIMEYLSGYFYKKNAGYQRVVDNIKNIVK